MQNKASQAGAAAEPAKIEVKNLWYRRESPYSRPTFTYTGKPLFTHRGVEVYKNAFYSSWDYVIGGCAITQRAGFSKDNAAQVIDDILDGRTWRDDAVCAHLRGLGFSPISYADGAKQEVAS